MSYPYNEINFDVFSEVPEETMTKAEQNRVLKDFYQKAGCYHHKKSHKKAWTGVIAACLVICLVATPIGDAAWAAMKQAFVGIGEYLGMTKQDDYATVVDQTQTKNGITVTLNDAIGSDNELRVSVTALYENGKALKDLDVEVADLVINGINRYSGFGNFGSDQYHSKEMKFMGMDFVQFKGFEMPLNPKIDISIYADGHFFDFSFILENKAFKEATRTAKIDKTFVYNNKRIILRQLIVTPIDQTITFDNPDGLNLDKVHDVNLYGQDNLGNKVSFNMSSTSNSFAGTRRNDDHTTYQISPDVTSFTLRAYDLDNADLDDLWNPKNAISEEFEVRL